MTRRCGRSGWSISSTSAAAPITAPRRLARGPIPSHQDFRGVVMPITIYGIKNCDTMKKARAWLDRRSVEYAFHDYKTAGIERAQLEEWVQKLGWETLLNRAGTTFRKLPDKDKNWLDAKKAIALMLAQPSMIKRPVLDLGGGKLLVGFAPETYSAAV